MLSVLNVCFLCAILFNYIRWTADVSTADISQTSPKRPRWWIWICIFLSTFSLWRFGSTFRRVFGYFTWDSDFKKNEDLATLESESDDSREVVLLRCQSFLIKPHRRGSEEAEVLSVKLLINDTFLTYFFLWLIRSLSWIFDVAGKKKPGFQGHQQINRTGLDGGFHPATTK